MVQYREDEDLGLVSKPSRQGQRAHSATPLQTHLSHTGLHHDDSDVTLNVCLGKEFTGATLSFCGGFGDSLHRKHTHTYTHQKGR